MQSYWAFTPKSFILILGLVLGVSSVGFAQAKSKRVMKDEVLGVVQSASATGDVPAATTALPDSGGAMKAIAVTPVEAVVASTAAATKSKSGSGMESLASVLQALSGNGQQAGTGAAGSGTTNSNTNSKTNSSAGSSGTTINNNYFYGGVEAASSRESSGGKKSGLALTKDDVPTTRDCSMNSKIWQAPFMKPFKVTSCYGMRTLNGETRRHDGVDMSAPETPVTIYPVSAGTVIVAGLAKGYGCQIVIKHDNCPKASGEAQCYSQYGHLAYNPDGTCPSKDLSGRELVGSRVGACTALGRMGNTGASEGAHLHMELRTSASSGTDINPIENFTEWQADKNYLENISSCGSVAGAKTPTRITPSEEANAVK